MEYKSLLEECAATDMGECTENELSKNNILDTYRDITVEVPEDVVYSAETIPVIKIEDDYVVESHFLVPFMRTNGITSIKEALDQLTDANELDTKVGLLVDPIDVVANAADTASVTDDKILNDLTQTNMTLSTLKNEGYTILRKKSK